MSGWHPFAEEIDLHVEDHISRADADRQTRTAREILKRLSERPGVVLADEVGMGKTFVALAVATSIALADHRRRPVVVMVPPSLREKWPRDFQLFRERCLPQEVSRKLRFGQADRAVQFLKLLDDPPDRRCSIIFLTHGAFSRTLQDGWVKAALIYRALYRRKDAALRRAVCRHMGRLLWMSWVEEKASGLWEELMATPPEKWLAVMQRRRFDPERKGNPEQADDPVPRPIVEALRSMELTTLYETLKEYVPRRQSKHLKQRLDAARKVITEQIRMLWGRCLRRAKYRLPLLIFDEAHHLKNAKTRLASLFHTPEAQEDADELARGPLAGVFERMLFLTATPFQLGHHELCSVLDRFDGIDWKSRRAPFMSRSQFRGEIKRLRTSLDRAQEAAVQFDHEWGKLRPEDLTADGKLFPDVDSWWRAVRQAKDRPPTATRVLEWHEKTFQRMREAERLLRPWVIRHLKTRTLPHRPAVPRRRCFPGKAILEESVSQDGQASGIEVSRDAVLPFLLAARATACTPTSRPVFAEGLASSYEAFLHTRQARAELAKSGDGATDLDDELTERIRLDEHAEWYLSHLEKVLPNTAGDRAAHPKVAATVRRALECWRHGEKVIVFCHYVATGRVLRRTITDAIRDEIKRVAAEKIGCPADAALSRLADIGEKFFRTASRVRQACDAEVGAILDDYPPLRANRDKWIAVIRRNLRLPSFLVRFFALERPVTGDFVRLALDARDASGMSLRQLLRHFFDFLARRCSAEDRERYLDAMSGIATGERLGAATETVFEDDELQGDRPERLMPNVRLVNGATRRETRQRLMLAFNTPFAPDVLITSNVLAEGVDLHLSCRYVIHHDLCWNPSTLEQRTGRVDRIGAKSERCGRPIHLYLPYLAETQDEKMYRVVMDRQRWFSVVMGEQYRVDPQTTDALAERVPLPQSVADGLVFRLEVPE